MRGISESVKRWCVEKEDEEKRECTYKTERPESILPVKSIEEKIRSIFYGKGARRREACSIVSIRYNRSRKKKKKRTISTRLNSMEIGRNCFPLFNVSTY